MCSDLIVLVEDRKGVNDVGGAQFDIVCHLVGVPFFSCIDLRPNPIGPDAYALSLFLSFPGFLFFSPLSQLKKKKKKGLDRPPCGTQENLSVHPVFCCWGIMDECHYQTKRNKSCVSKLFGSPLFVFLFPMITHFAQTKNFLSSTRPHSTFVP